MNWCYLIAIGSLVLIVEEHFEMVFFKIYFLPDIHLCILVQWRRYTRARQVK